MLIPEREARSGLGTYPKIYFKNFIIQRVVKKCTFVKKKKKKKLENNKYVH